MDNAIKSGETDQNNEDAQKKSIALVKQAKKIEKLFQAIDEPVDIPAPSYAQGSVLRPPPDFVRNSGAVSGASSLEFQLYRNLRRKEQIRLQEMDSAARSEVEKREYEEKRALQRMQEDERTAKKRAQRQKKKQNKKLKPNESQKNSSERNPLENGEKDKVLAPLPNIEASSSVENQVSAHVVSKNVRIIEDE